MDALSASGLAGAYDSPLLLTSRTTLPAATRNALTASPAAAKVHYPILLVGSATVPAATSNAITTLGITRKYIVGGTTAVSSGVATTLGVPAGDRIAGANRYSTAVAFATRAKTDGWLAYTTIGVAATATDALTGGPAMGKLGGPMLLTSSTSLPAETSAFLGANKAAVMQSYVFGGTSAVSNGVYNAISMALQ